MNEVTRIGVSPVALATTAHASDSIRGMIEELHKLGKLSEALTNGKHSRLLEHVHMVDDDLLAQAFRAQQTRLLGKLPAGVAERLGIASAEAAPGSEPEAPPKKGPRTVRDSTKAGALYQRMVALPEGQSFVLSPEEGRTPQSLQSSISTMMRTIKVDHPTALFTSKVRDGAVHVFRLKM